MRYRFTPAGDPATARGRSCHHMKADMQKILDTGGRVARFEKRFGKNPSTKASDKK
jgi:hypothetical protein